jgi:hypothetical protein
MDNQDQTPAADLARIVESARRLGVELDEAETLQWLAAMAAEESGEEIVVDEARGIFGHKITLLDFNPQELARFRELGKLVAFKDEPGLMESALALSGSTAQSKIQTYPGDADFFEQHQGGDPRGSVRRARSHHA